MKKYILAGVGTIEGFTQSSTQPAKVFTSTTLQESGLTISVTAEDIRGGLSNPLLGRYFHDSVLEANIVDALFDLSYLALNVGGEVTVGGDTLVTETVTVATANQITVTGTPVAFGNAGTVGWFTPQGEDNWTPITFNGKTAQATVAKDAVVCVRYNATNDALKEFIIPSSVIPSELHVIMTYPLFAAGSDKASLSTSSQVGELIVDIPRFQFAGNVELSLTSSGVATSNLSGSALAMNTAINCKDLGRYGTVKMNIFDQNWYDDLIALAIDNADIALKNSATETLKVIGIYQDGGTILTNMIDNAKLTFTSGDTSKATVGAHTGVVTAAASGTGEAVIEVVVTEKTSVTGYATVTVTAS